MLVGLIDRSVWDPAAANAHYDYASLLLRRTNELAMAADQTQSTGLQQHDIIEWE